MAMRVTVPALESEVIPGDKEEERPSVHRSAGSLVVVPQFDDKNIEEAGRKMQALVREGIGLRSIVCEKGADYTDPNNWGTIVNVEPFTSFPLHVRWTSGPRTRTDGRDLVVIHRCMSKEDIKLYMEMNKRLPS